MHFFKYKMTKRDHFVLFLMAVMVFKDIYHELVGNMYKK